MAREIELKLAVAPECLRQMADAPWLARWRRGPSHREDLVSVYFDTAGYSLRDEGITLRVRHSGTHTVQTIKRSTDGRLLERSEWEEEIDGSEPDLSRTVGTALEPLASIGLARKLKPLFETDIHRTVIPVGIESATIEIAVDEGTIVASHACERVSEIELELKEGDAKALATLAGIIAENFPVTLEAQTKPERGFSLLGGKSAGAVFAADIVLNPNATVAEAFEAIAQSCLRHFAANRDAVAAGDPEGVHQMRVGLRRLRAALSIFKEAIEGADTEALKSELKWITGQLTAARDCDVFATETLAPLKREPQFARGAIEALDEEIAARRANGFEQAKVAVASDRYRKLVLRTALWIMAGDWRADGHALARARQTRACRDFAAEVLSRRRKRIVKRARTLETLDARRRHKLRLAVKKLRYGTEFFASLFDNGKKQRQFAASLKDLQTTLGNLNDYTVHDELAHSLTHDNAAAPEAARKAFAMGVVIGKERREARRCIRAAATAADALRRTRPFWK